MEDRTTIERTQPSNTAVGDAALRFDRGSLNGRREPYGVWDAVRSNWLIVLAAVVICTGVALAAATVRTPKYAATTTLSVLHLNFGVAGGLSSFSTAGSLLADTYARAVRADGVVRPVAAELHTSPATIRSQLSSSVVPASPVFSVTATTATPARAVTVANLAAAQLEKYIQAINASNSDAPRIYRDLTHAEETLSVQQQNLAGLLATFSRSRGSLSSSDRMALAKARANVSIAQDKVTSLKEAYNQSTLGQAATQFIQPLQAAAGAASDKRKKQELLGFVGLAVGLGVGVALAMLRRGRRRLR
jgi:capsular polysaccharide biosynthesis protein